MSHEISVSVGKPFGLQWVCRVLDFPRSTIYAVRARANANVTPMVVRRAWAEAEDARC
jgi:putative transposase